MSWDKTYTHTVAIALDIFAASLIFNRADVTISSMCGLALRSPQGSKFLRGLGRALNWVSANHCESAIQSDRARAKSILQITGE